MNKIRFSGFMQQRFFANMENWLLTVPVSNPAMVEIFRQREKENQPHLVQWYGEFPGKYLTGAALHYEMSGEERLKATGDRLVEELASVQAQDGYLGPFSKNERFIPSGDSPERYFTWDVWGHYHCILGLMCWFQATGNRKAQNIACKAADYVMEFFGTGGRNILEAGWTEMNLSISHVYALLYEETGQQAYLNFALHVMDCWQDENGGNYYQDALKGLEFYQMRKPRWESLHAVQTLGELYKITGKQDYLTALSNIWWSILKTDRHNTGGFSAGEQAQGTPYHTGAIETCCTVAWLALTYDMYELFENPLMADEMELSTYNGILSAQNPSGRWTTYNTPMSGVKKASAHEIVFQAMPGSPELNCCSVNWPRGLGMVEKWAMITKTDTVILNYYGGGTIESATPKGQPLLLIQKTQYPLDGEVKIKVNLEQEEDFSLKLRIPAWSQDTVLSVNGISYDRPASGSYADLTRTWQDGDEISLSFDMSLHYWVGDENLSGCASVYRGPLLLAYDQRWNDLCQPPQMSVNNMEYTFVKDTGGDHKPLLLLQFHAKDNQPVYLCDFITAGMNGTYYTTWLPMEGLSPVPFSKEHPVWNVR